MLTLSVVVLGLERLVVGMDGETGSNCVFYMCGGVRFVRGFLDLGMLLNLG